MDEQVAGMIKFKFKGHPKLSTVLRATVDVIAIAVLLSIILYTYLSVIENPDRYFIVNGVVVSDSVEGTYPDVFYNRIIKREVWVDWSINVFRTKNPFDSICHGFGQNYYTKKDTETHLVFDEYIGVDDCKLGPGTYAMDSTWILNGNQNMIVKNISNEFTIK